MAELKTGARFSWSRKVTDEDIGRFADLTGDKGAHHVQRDEQGRLMAHGLLTASLPTKIGGDLDFMARVMHFEFAKPVYGGDVLTCSGTIDSAVVQTTRIKARISFEVVNQRGEVVLKGTAAGMSLRKP
jgi:acyl dehydratase